jgi:hypothetical protein
LRGIYLTDINQSILGENGDAKWTNSSALWWRPSPFDGLGLGRQTIRGGFNSGFRQGVGSVLLHHLLSPPPTETTTQQAAENKVEAADAGGTASAEVDSSGNAQAGDLRRYIVEPEGAASKNTSAQSSSITVFLSGAGCPTCGDNEKFSNLATEIGGEEIEVKAVASKFAGVLGRGPVNKAMKKITSDLRTNPTAKIYIVGYSAGGEAAVSLVRKLAAKGIGVEGLVVFDPHNGMRLIGGGDFAIPTNVKNAVAFFQKDANPFVGGNLIGTQVQSHDLTGLTTHLDIVTYSWNHYESEIRNTLGR